MNLLVISILGLGIILIGLLYLDRIKRNKTISLLLEKCNHQRKSLLTQSDCYLKEINELKASLKQNTEQLSEENEHVKKIEDKIDSEVLKRTSELHSLLEQAHDSNKLKEAFLEKISREIRTPLNAILGFINLLNEPELSNHDREYYSKYIQESGNNLLGLIDNIIDFSKLETNELKIEPKRCKFDILLTDLVDNYRSRLIRQKPGVNIIFKNTVKDIESLIDCKRVLHVVNQLVSNAIKFTETGKIELVYNIKDNNHYFEVTDTGIGINKKYQDIIFERFYQIETATSDIFQGAGLGLTIAKGLIDLLGGKIKLKSASGEGSTFSFTVPLIRIDKFESSTAKTVNVYNWENKNILIAEDEDSNFHFLEAILKRTKVNITRAEDGIKFLEIMNEKKNVDLVLLDIKMPGINGFNAIKVVRQQNITIPVIAQTAFNQPEDKQRCLDSGCNDYLAKPIDKDLLLSKIAKFFGS